LGVKVVEKYSQAVAFRLPLCQNVSEHRFPGINYKL